MFKIIKLIKRSYMIRNIKNGELHSQKCDEIQQINVTKKLRDL